MINNGNGSYRGNFIKYPHNPVFGDAGTGTCFDACVIRENGLYRMDFSWRSKRALAVTFSGDGICWSEPKITLQADLTSGWEDNINRDCVLYIDGKYKIWYTGQARGYSFIGYAESADGLSFQRVQREPVLIPERMWEGMSVMCPFVLYEDGIYKMWYAAGETYEPNVIAYAESDDGIVWRKSRINPIFTASRKNAYEKDRIGGCQVMHTDDMGYLMFYIGYADINTACVCAARSDDGITRWERLTSNPQVYPEAESWDCDSCYKPTFLWDGAVGKWRLWYNGRRKNSEYIGLAEHHGRILC